MNPASGEIELDFGGKTVTLRPTFASLMLLDKKLGYGMVGMMRRIAQGEFGLGDVAGLVWAGMIGSKQNKPDLSFDEVGDIILRDGLDKYLAPVTLYAVNTLTAGRKVGSDPKAETVTETTPAP